jgi:hypothetical protein
MVLIGVGEGSGPKVRERLSDSVDLGWRDHDVPELPPDDLLGGEAAQALACAVEADHPTLRVEHENQGAGDVEDRVDEASLVGLEPLSGDSVVRVGREHRVRGVVEAEVLALRVAGQHPLRRSAPGLL